jgi:hypothetical protein
VYARRVEKDGQELILTLSVSGMLWNRSLVMIDSETESLWSHLLGKAMQGQLEGMELETLPGLMTDWKTWRTRHPETTVVTLRRTANEFRTRIYRNPKAFVVGLARGKRARFWAFDQLEKEPVVNEDYDGKPLLVVYEKESGTAFLYDRRVGDQTLTFSKTGKNLVDDTTRSTWEVTSGLAVDGPLAGKSLKLVPGIVSFRVAWMAFHPESEEFLASPP